MPKKVALVHDQLREFGGAERVLVALKQIFPEADVFTSIYEPESLGRHQNLFANWNIITSWFDKIPVVRSLYSPLRFLTPYIWEAFDFSEYDLVISSSGSCMSHGIITRPETLHIVYLHHPPRYLYGYETAIEWQKYWPIKLYGHLINHDLRMWDYVAAQRPDYFIANSEETKKRIAKFYRRDSHVIYPPVTPKTSSSSYKVNNQTTEDSKQLRKETLHASRCTLHEGNTYYITTSRLARAKHVDILIHAANQYGFQLKIIGTGRELDYLRSIAGPTVTFLNSVSDDEFDEIYYHAKAFLFASVDEEFGIAPVEAMSRGVPVIAYASGGLKEIVQHDKNGLLYEELSVESLGTQIRELEQFDTKKLGAMKQAAQKSAEHYSFDVFKKNILTFIEERS